MLDAARVPGSLWLFPFYFSGFQFFDMFPFALSDYGSQNLHFGSGFQRKYFIYNLVNGLLLDFSAADRAMRNTDSRIEKSHIVIDFGNGTDGGTGIF